jgi:hypothetical protein
LISVALFAPKPKKQPSDIEFWCQSGAIFSGLPEELPHNFPGLNRARPED